jgi:hypothetical protein
LNDADLAQLLGAAAIGVLVAVLFLIKRDDYVATIDFVHPEPQDGAGTTGADAPVARTFRTGAVVPGHIGEARADKVRKQRRSWLAAIVVGKDNRTSTSKTMAFLWTLAIVWGLLALMIAAWLKDRTGWDYQTDELGFQEEYLLLLGGPYAAAILAKTVTSARSETKTDAEPGDANVAQLVTDDKGDAELGDFQYVLFGLLTLAFFIGDFVGDTEHGFPVLPALLTGLALTSVAGYSAKKLLAEATPKMTAVVPTRSAPLGDVQIYGADLTIPAGVSGAGADAPPTVTLAGTPVPVTSHEKHLGNDRVTFNVPQTAAAGTAPIGVTRADGVPAKTPTGENVLPFEVLPEP